MAVSKVLMPKLSEAMETGKIIKWLKKEGSFSRPGAPCRSAGSSGSSPSPTRTSPR
jgi:hypothetical protein